MISSRSWRLKASRNALRVSTVTVELPLITSPSRIRVRTRSHVEPTDHALALWSSSRNNRPHDGAMPWLSAAVARLGSSTGYAEAWGSHLCEGPPTACHWWTRPSNQYAEFFGQLANKRVEGSFTKLHMTTRQGPHAGVCGASHTPVAQKQPPALNEGPRYHLIHE